MIYVLSKKQGLNIYQYLHNCQISPRVMINDSVVGLCDIGDKTHTYVSKIPCFESWAPQGELYRPDQTHRARYAYIIPWIMRTNGPPPTGMSPGLSPRGPRPNINIVSMHTLNFLIYRGNSRTRCKM